MNDVPESGGPSDAGAIESARSPSSREGREDGGARAVGVTRHVRGAAKMAAFGLVSSVMFVLHLVTVPLPRLLGFRRLAARWSARQFRTWTRWVAAILGMHIEESGTPPRAPFFLVSNHLSYVDLVVLASRLDCVFVARSDVAGWPVFGAMCRVVGTIFIDRESKRDIPRVLARIEETLAEGRGVIVFPEGTSTDGATVLRFKPSLLETAARAGLPVSYASLSYRTPALADPARLAVCWWGNMSFPRHLVRLFRLPGFRASVRFGEETFQESDRKLLAEKLRDAVRAGFEPVG